MDGKTGGGQGKGKLGVLVVWLFAKFGVLEFYTISKSSIVCPVTVSCACFAAQS